jgi:hypothetical protein
MISLLKRTNPAWGLAIVLLSLGLVGACRTPKPDAREELVRSLKGASVDGYYFATSEDETQMVTSLDNSAMRNPIKLASGSMVLRYTSVRDKKANTTRIYKTEIARNGAVITILVTDIASGEVAMKKDLAADKNGTGNGGNGAGNDCTQTAKKVFNSEPECANDFFSDCTRGGFVQCEANRTCEPQISGFDCCFKNGSGVAVTVIVWPTKLCLTRPYLPGDEQRLVLTQ